MSKKLDISDEERRERKRQSYLKWISNPENKEKDRARNEARRASDHNKEYRKAYMKDYNDKETTKAKKAEYRSKEDVKIKRSEYSKLYRSRPNVILSEAARIAEYNKRPDVIARKRERSAEYNKRPDVIERTKAVKMDYVRRSYVKEKNRESCKKYSSNPNIKERKALFNKEKYSSDPAYRDRILDWARKFGGRHHRRAEKRGGYAERFPRVIVFERDKYTCSYCGCKLSLKTATLDHVIPISKGGAHVPDNCTTACRPCNSSKKDKVLSGIQATIFDRV